jgi:hypothetical protein
VTAGRRVYRATLAELIEALGRAEREGRLIEKIRFLGRSSLLIVDEIGYLPITPGGANLFFQLVNARYEKGAMILTSNRGFAEWGRCSETPSSPPRCSIGCSTMPSSSRSKAPATACAPTPTSSPSTPARTPPSPRRHRQNDAVGRRKRNRPCLISAEPNSRKWGIFVRHFWGFFIRHLQMRVPSPLSLRIFWMVIAETRTPSSASVASWRLQP